MGIGLGVIGPRSADRDHVRNMNPLFCRLIIVHTCGVSSHIRNNHKVSSFWFSVFFSFYDFTIILIYNFSVENHKLPSVKKFRFDQNFYKKSRNWVKSGFPEQEQDLNGIVVILWSKDRTPTLQKFATHFSASEWPSIGCSKTRSTSSTKWTVSTYNCKC